MADPSAPIDVLAWRELAQHTPLGVLLGLDGTLVSPQDRPETCLPPAVAELLEALHRSSIQVVIVSGRARSRLEPMAAQAPHAWWFGEHGAWSCIDGSWHGPTSECPELDDLGASLAARLETAAVRIERKTVALCLHWRQVEPSARPGLLAGAAQLCDQWLATRPQYERMPALDAFEVRLRTAHKGTAVARVRDLLPGARLIAFGDDRSDEDLFAALGERDLAIAVGDRLPRSSKTRLTVGGPLTVHSMLSSLVEARARPELLQPLGPGPHAIARTRLLVISNRTSPAPVGRERQVGGLVSTLELALRALDGMWLGWSGDDADAPPSLHVDYDAQPPRATFDLTPLLRERFHVGFCSGALWPLLHAFSGGVQYSDAAWSAYVEVNTLYARFAASLIGATSTVWVHDYHLLLVADMLRTSGHRGPIGFFLHVPFPPRDRFETLPWCDHVLEAMRAFDLIGFHTDRWAENFTTCLRAHDQRVGTRSRWPLITVLPIGVDPAAFLATETDGDPDREVAALRSSLGDSRLILSVDRLDDAKGIPERLAAFERLLEIYEEWRGRVTLVQISAPSHTEVPDHVDLRRRVESLVGRINGRFGEASWVPVHYLFRAYKHRVLAQLYRTADVALVTPLCDGLNLTAKEFVAAQEPTRPGVLVLSRFAGAAIELTDAILTNPYHADGLAADLDRALRMPLEERQQRHAALAAVVAKTTPQDWATAFLEHLDSTRLAPR